LRQCSACSDGVSWPGPRPAPAAPLYDNPLAMLLVVRRTFCYLASSLAFGTSVQLLLAIKIALAPISASIWQMVSVGKTREVLWVFSFQMSVFSFRGEDESRILLFYFQAASFIWLLE